MEFIKGRHPKLLSPFQHDRGELTDLVETRKTLQGHLDEAGFVGTEWPAGKGNPVALNDSLLEDDSDGNYKWVMVDCESGVPPYAPISLKALGYYIKQSVKLRRFLFDDVDIDKLARYVPERKKIL